MAPESSLGFGSDPPRRGLRLPRRREEATVGGFMSDIPGDITHDQHAVRRQKLAELRSAGTDPFRANFATTHFSGQALAAYVDGQDYAVRVRVAGRLTIIRDMGKSQFAKILDQQGLIQIYLKKDVLGEAAYAAFRKLDIGDIVGVDGTLFKTKAGEVTVKADSVTLVSKALRPLPEKWHGLTDPEQIYRQRYLDLIVNPDSRKRLQMRSRVVSSIRRFLEQRQYIEVETPVLQAVAGGAAARPFVTHHDTLGSDFFLRISLELYLKRLLVAGWDRVFEIGRNFRNEGISRKHNPEFTMLELYEAYSDHRGMMVLIKDMLQMLCRDVVGSMKIPYAGGGEIDFGGEWREVTYKDLIREETGDPEWFNRSPAEHVEAATRLGLKIEAGWQDFEVTNEIFSKRIEPKLVQPTFVLNLPKELCPLAKISESDPATLDVFELCIGGMEVAPAYSEQNDPDVQRSMFEQQAGDEKQSIDQDFLLALEHGMPPAGGMGVGIDRLCILLTGAESIRDVILFPQLRPGGAA
jgi:lysyl-tRNA synthetase, class II